MTLDQFIAQMRQSTAGAFAISKAETREEIGAALAEDIVCKTLSMARDYTNWPEEGHLRGIKRQQRPLPYPAKTTPPGPKAQKTETPIGGGESDDDEQEISLDDIQP